MVATFSPKTMGSNDNMLCIAWVNTYGGIAKACLAVIAKSERGNILPLTIKSVVFPDCTIGHV